jgi:hypothetical protein
MTHKIKKTNLLFIFNLFLLFSLLIIIFLYIKLSYLPITKNYLKRKYELDKWHDVVNKYIDRKKQIPKDLRVVIMEMEYLPYLEIGQLSKNNREPAQDPNQLLRHLEYIIVSGEQEWFIVESQDTRNQSRMFIDKEGRTYVTRILFNENK